MKTLDENIAEGIAKVARIKRDAELMAKIEEMRVEHCFCFECSGLTCNTCDFVRELEAWAKGK